MKLAAGLIAVFGMVVASEAYSVYSYGGAYPYASPYQYSRPGAYYNPAAASAYNPFYQTGGAVSVAAPVFAPVAAVARAPVAPVSAAASLQTLSDGGIIDMNLLNNLSPDQKAVAMQVLLQITTCASGLLPGMAGGALNAAPRAYAGTDCVANSMQALADAGIIDMNRLNTLTPEQQGVAMQTLGGLMTSLTSFLPAPGSAAPGIAATEASLNILADLKIVDLGKLSTLDATQKAVAMVSLQDLLTSVSGLMPGASSVVGQRTRSPEFSHPYYQTPVGNAMAASAESLQTLADAGIINMDALRQLTPPQQTLLLESLSGLMTSATSFLPAMGGLGQLRI